MEAVALDIGGIMTPTFVVPDTSGLAPLSLPESFLERHDTPQPYPDAIRRFETAMGDDAPRAAAQAFYASLAIADTPQQVAQDGNAVPTAADKPVGQLQNPVAASCDPPVSGQDTLRDAGGTLFIASESGAASQLPQNPVAASCDPPVGGQNALRDAGGAQFIVSESGAAPQLPHNPVAASCDPSVSGQNALRDAGGTQFIAPESKSVSQLPQNPVAASGDPSVIGKSTLRDAGGTQFIASDIKSAPVQAADATDETEKVAVLQAAPVQVAAPDAIGVSVQATPEVAAVSAASARTESIVDTVNQIVDAVVGQIVVTPSLVQGEGEVRMTLKPTVLDGSDITLTAKDGTLTVAVTPATPAAEQAVAAALPRLEIALAEHAPAFRHVAVALVAKKGKIDETA